MDKRIIDLKKQIIKENIDKIMLLSETGSLEFTPGDNLRMLNDVGSKAIFIRDIRTNGNMIWLTVSSGEDCFGLDVEFMDLEEMDYNITSVLDNLLKNK